MSYCADVHGDDIRSDGYPANCTAGHSLWCRQRSQNPYSVIYQCRTCEDGYIQSQELSVDIQTMNCDNTTSEYYACKKCEDNTVSNDERTKCEGK